MKKLIASILTAGLALSLMACGAKSEKNKNHKGEVIVSEVQTEPSHGLDGEYKATDTEEYFKIYDLTDSGFKVEFYHFEEGLLEKFDYEMEFDNAEKTIASEKGSVDDNGGWEYAFAISGDTIKVTWQQNEQLYKRAS